MFLRQFAEDLSGFYLDEIGNYGFDSSVYGDLYGTHTVDKTSHDVPRGQTMVAATWTALNDFAGRKKCGCSGIWTDGMWTTINNFLQAPDGPFPGYVEARYAYGEDPRLDYYLENRRIILGVPPRFPWNR